MSFLGSVAMAKFGAETALAVIQGGLGLPIAMELEEVKEGPIKAHMESMRTILKIKKPLSLLISNKTFVNLMPFGNTCLPGEAGIVLSKFFYENRSFDEDEINFCITREMVHLKRNDTITWQFLSPIMGIALSIFINPFAGVGASTCFVNYLIRPWIEEEIDRVSLENSSKETQKAALSFFKKLKLLVERSEGVDHLRIRNFMSQYPPLEWRIALAERHVKNPSGKEGLKTA